ncbi:MAG TPA: hypothetical protein VGV15_16105 [Terriglobales bacterium]|nr:hypothetical protein [Terriglobales bacterium]
MAKAGADFLICPDNTIHQAFDLVEHRSPRPWLRPVYPDKLKATGLEYRVPGGRRLRAYILQ